MKTLHTTTHCSSFAIYATSQLQRGAGGIGCSATLRSRLHQRKIGDAVERASQDSNTVKVTVHDKDMVLDGRSIQTGSINYTKDGTFSNSEDAVIEWNDAAGAADFERHFQSRLATCRPI